MNKLKDYKTTDKGEWREFALKSDELKVLNKIITNIEQLENACKEFKELNIYYYTYCISNASINYLKF